ncbi:hypothetical protein FA13DRAFT_1732546 [Coprinellus micaceus]|uniref:Uncharacterized protein n=1 Tax=Coprinellus micaceus TaxID=71717 RepID=A0A4Y7TDM8_COPMI|nr:hypothetical protein FA13DRAFT_1732546 [Coprinellus micaceus]
MNLESLSLAGSLEYETIRHSVVRPPHGYPRPGTTSPSRIAALYDSLLQEMMQNVLIRPTFDVERETQRYLRLSDLLKEGRMTAPWGDFDVASDLPITSEVLESLQGRLEDPQQTPPSSSTNPFSAASDRVAPRTITLMDVARAHLKDSEEPFTTFYRLKLIVTITGKTVPIRRLGKLRPSRNSVELSAVWEKRTFRFREFLKQVEMELNRRDGTGGANRSEHRLN